MSSLRRCGIGLACMGLVVTAGGCDPWRRQALRSDAGAGQSGQAAHALEDPSYSQPEELKGFFKANRKAGSLSSEAREIEESLGALNH